MRFAKIVDPTDRQLGMQTGQVGKYADLSTTWFDGWIVAGRINFRFLAKKRTADFLFQTELRCSATPVFMRLLKQAGNDKMSKMTAPSFAGVFPHYWTAEILPRRPMILPTRHYVYPAAVEEVEKGALEVLIQPGVLVQTGAAQESSQPFLATCALGFRDPAAPTGLWSMPNPEWLCAVSGGYAYLIDTAHPEIFTHLRYRPVLHIESYLPSHGDSARGLLLFVSHHTILAWGHDGEAWESERLSWEGVTVERIDGSSLHGRGWDLMTDRETPFTLDLTNGRRVPTT